MFSQQLRDSHFVVCCSCASSGQGLRPWTRAVQGRPRSVHMRQAVPGGGCGRFRGFPSPAPKGYQTRTAGRGGRSVSSRWWGHRAPRTWPGRSATAAPGEPLYGFVWKVSQWDSAAQIPDLHRLGGGVGFDGPSGGLLASGWYVEVQGASGGDCVEECLYFNGRGLDRPGFP